MRNLCWLTGLTLTLAACSANSQVVLRSSGGGSVSTRAELQQQLADLEAILTSREYSEAQKRGPRVEADRIRERLELGDFRVGDRILLTVQGEEQLPDTLTVEPGLVVRMALFGETTVGGVLRAEITDHLTKTLSEYIRDPVVLARGLMRVSVLGSVGNPGFFTMPAETVLGDALMVAGGPNTNANLDNVLIRRGTMDLMEGDAVQEAIRQGLTLDQLNLQAGDQIVVPQRGQGLLRNVALVMGAIGSVSFLVWRLFTGDR